MTGVFVVGVLLVLVNVTHALPEPDTRFLEVAQADYNDIPFVFDNYPKIGKRDLEFNQYVPAYRLRGEPSCDELRAMWRLSKREARRATSTNNIPRSRPYTYGRLLQFAPKPHMPYAYAEQYHYPTGIRRPIFKGSFNKLRTMLGIQGGRPGSFKKLKSMVDSQRLPGESSKGKFYELKDKVLDYHRQNSPSMEEESPGVPSLKSTQVYQPVRRTPSIQLSEASKYPPESLLEALLTASAVFEPSNWGVVNWNPEERSCEDVRYAPCKSDNECVCAGQFRCSKNRCKVLLAHSGRPELLLRKLTEIDA